MSIYPIHLETESLDHRGGTKSYHFMLLSNSEGKSLVVTRWGKTGVFGQFKVERFDTVAGARNAMTKKRNEKRGGGYAPAASDMKTLDDAGALKAALGFGYFPTFGADNLHHLDPAFDTTGVRDPKIDRDENGEVVVDKKHRIDPELMRQAQEEEERVRKEAQNAELRANPLFGLF